MITLEGLKAEGPTLPRAAGGSRCCSTLQMEESRVSVPESEGSMCWCLQTCLLTSPGPSSSPVHQQPPAAPAPAYLPPPQFSPLPLGKQRCQAPQFRKAIQAKSKKHITKKKYFSDDFPTGTLEPTRKAWEQPAATAVFGVLAFWMPFLYLRWRTFMLHPVKYLWCHLQTPTVPADTSSLPLVPAAWSRRQEQLLWAPLAVRRNLVTHRGCWQMCLRY